MLQLSDARARQCNGQTREGLEATILGLKQAQHEAQMMGRQFLMTGRQINESLRDRTPPTPIDSFFQKVGRAERHQRAVAEFVQFAADFLRRSR
jgi:hypothetical protein